MMAKKKNEGFHSAAGLIRYFDSEDEKAFRINPWVIIGVSIAAAIGLEVLRVAFPV